MSDIIRRHVSQYPHARTSTIQYLVKRDEMTERLRQELTRSYQREAMDRMQKSRWSLLAWLMGR
jgi:uncharacterized protein YqgQ